MLNQTNNYFYWYKYRFKYLKIFVSFNEQKKKISELVKNAVSTIEPGAEIILFGSRARDDYSEQSDWDFLILVDKEATEKFKMTPLYQAIEKEGIHI